MMEDSRVVCMEGDQLDDLMHEQATGGSPQAAKQHLPTPQPRRAVVVTLPPCISLFPFLGW